MDGRMRAKKNYTSEPVSLYAVVSREKMKDEGMLCQITLCFMWSKDMTVNGKEQTN